jgi:arylsulfatase A-like enzyme
MTESVDVAPTILELLGSDMLPGQHGQSLRPYLEKKRRAKPRTSIFSEYLENEEAFVRTSRWKLIHGSGKRERTDGYKTDNPTPGRTVRLYDLDKDPGEFHDVAAEQKEVVGKLSAELLGRFRLTHPESGSEPNGLTIDDAIEWYLRPRDAKI